MNRNSALALIVAALFISAALCLDRSSAGNINLVEPGMAGIATPTPTPIPTLTPFTPSPTPTPLCGSGNWELVAPFPFSGTRMAVASDGVFAYAAGGVTVPQQNTMYRYDPSADSWSALANMPSAFSSGRAVYSPVTNSIYVFGGSSITVPNLNTTYIYNVGTNTWTTGASMPAGRNSVQVAYYSATNKIYVIGGLVGGPNGSQEQSQVWEYDPASNTWNTSRQDAPHGIGAGAIGLQGQYVYVGGGLGDLSGHGSTQHYRYDIVNNSWAALAPLPMPVYYPVGASAGGKNYVVGGGNPSRPGESPESAFRSTFIYDPVTDVWATGPSTNVGHAQAGGTAIGNRLLVLAGLPGGGGSTNVVEMYMPPAPGCPTPTPVTPTPTPTPTPSPTLTPTPMTPTPTPTPTPSPTLTPSPCAPGQWMFRANYPIGIYEVAVTTDGSSVYAFGGTTLGPSSYDPVAAANRYDPVTDSWTALAPMSTGPDKLMGAEYGGNGKIYVMGGASGPALNRIYDIPSNTWSMGAPIPLGRRSFAHAYYNGKIYVIGGFAGSVSAAVHAYDIASNTWTTQASLPQPRHNTTAGVIDGRIYVARGSPPTGNGSNTLFIYDIAANSWSVGPTAPSSDYGSAGTVVARKLWVIGGNDAPILIYDPSVSTWSVGPSLNQRRSYPGAATIISQGGETAVVVGGNDNGSFIPRNTVEASSIYGCPTPTPMTPSPIPTPTPMTPTPTPTVTPFTPSPTPTPSSPGGSPTPSATSSPCACPSPTPTPAVSPTPVVTPTPILRFCNGAPIDMTSNQPAAPYPSTITVAGAPPVAGEFIVTLNNLWQQFPDNIDVLLVGPLGQKFVLLGDAGGPIAIPQNNPVTLRLRDFQPNVLPDNGPLTTGTFMPTTWETPVTSFPPPAPPAPYVEPGHVPFPPINQTMFGSFGLTNPNGNWNLYVRDDGGNPLDPEVVIGSISGGWCLEIIPPTAAGVSLSGRVMTASGAGIRNARAVITGNSLSEPRIVTTGSFGYYSFEGLTAGETYVVTVNSQRFTFQTPARVYSLVDNIVDADFVANEP